MSFRIGAYGSKKRRRRILRFAMLYRTKIRRRQQISLLSALIMAATEETMPGNVAHVRRFWTIPRNQLWFETRLVGYFKVTLKIHYLINFT